MHALVGIELVLAGLLVLAGAQKVVDPAMTVGALRALRVPVGAPLVRAGAAAELMLGIAALTVSGPVAWWLVALSFAAFALFVLVALRAGTPIGSCGCFGREETPPHWSHVLLNLLLASGAVLVAGVERLTVVESLADHPLDGVLVTGLAAVSLYLLHALYVHVPRTLQLGAQARASTAPVAQVWRRQERTSHPR